MNWGSCAPVWFFAQDVKNANVEDVLILSGDHLYRMDYMDFVQVRYLRVLQCLVSCLTLSKRDQDAWTAVAGALALLSKT